jgi:hypothetical protein
MSWLLTGREVAFVTQVNVPVGGSGDSWSLADVALDVAFLLRTANDVWKTFDIYGEAAVAFELKVGGLSLYQGDRGYYSIFYNSDLFIVPSIIRGVSGVGSAGRAELETNFVSRTKDLPDTVAIIANQLLRDLGYSADLNTARIEVAKLLTAVDQIYSPR